MCGLTGFLSSKPRDDNIRHVTSMTARLVHRGPDDDGLWSEGSIGLGHRRLAIVDLSATGAQPMHSECGRYVLAYNGEVYNHLTLRHALETAGVAPKWRGQSDSETLLAAIAHWGLSDALCRAHGMFALALWDRAEGRLSLARDRMGEKPLYWGWAGQDLVFGSELKALRAHPDFPHQVCRDALAQYLRFSYVPAPRSIHPGIYKLEPGCIVQIDGPPPAQAPKEPLRPSEALEGLSIRRYWSLNAVIEAGVRDLIHDEAVAVAGLEDVLAGAVQRQMMADVPLGAFLSGGVDSSAIVALMQAQSPRPVKKQ
jgi:asparagine synthase (glutamine-hydrolysing)